MPQDQFKNAAPDRILDVANVIEVNIQTPWQFFNRTW
jgi:hypothetical protein